MGHGGQSDCLSWADGKQLGRVSAWNKRPGSRAPESSIRKHRYTEKGQRESPTRAVSCSEGISLGQTTRYPAWQQRELMSKKGDILGDSGWPGDGRRDQMGD